MDRGELGFRAVLDAAPDAMIVVGGDGTITFANERALELFGLPRAELVGSSVDRLVPERYRGGHTRLRATYAGEPHRRPMGAGTDLTALRADGTEIPVEISLSPVDVDGTTQTITAIRDVSDRRRADAILSRAEQQAAIAEVGRLALDGGQIEDLVGHATLRVAEVLGVARTAVFIRRSDGAPGEDALLAGEDGDGGVTLPLTVRGRTVGVLGVAPAALRTFTSDEVHFLRTLANLLASALERARTEEEVGTSRAQLRAILDNTPAPIYLKDVEGRMLVVNRAYERLFGLAPGAAVGTTDADVFTPEDALRVRANDARVIAGRAPMELEEEVLTPRGLRTFLSLKFPMLDERGEPYGVGGVSTDITDRVRAQAEQRKLEAQLHRAQRLESVGQLAGGIAHDFNNLLAVISNFAGFVAAEVPAGSPAAEDVEQIQQAARRATELTRRLLVFSRREVGRTEVLDLNAVVADIRAILSRTLGEHIELHTRLAGDLHAVTADAGQLEQVLMNLAVNARDAMPDGGTLTIETRNVDLDREFARAHADDRLIGRFVELAVSDTGQGMSDETRSRAFEPFFSTKPSGVGTGLGLATVYGIVTAFGGHVGIYSSPGSGTSVRVHLPAVAGTAPERAEAAPAEPERGHGERVLVVEDEAGVRAAAIRILRGGGYDVLEAEDGTAALGLLGGAEEPVDLLLTDVIMPGMSGSELAATVRERHPDVAVVFMSGYTDDVLLGRGIESDDGFVDKPFTAAQLLDAVRDALRTGRSPDRPIPPRSAIPDDAVDDRGSRGRA
ncbi:MAG TPA: PAS domain S-box protein [Solirubrobacteraceae bacterium]|nr:PAS domain S-box protein [Solirubrobacteraceae bacterium]